MSSESLLSPLQRELLYEFFSRQTGRRFFLTGGTALAEYYFRHRLSEDILALADEQFRDIQPPD